MGEKIIADDNRRQSIRAQGAVSFMKVFSRPKRFISKTRTGFRQ
jgi:hypothetical protein